MNLGCERDVQCVQGGEMDDLVTGEERSKEKRHCTQMKNSL